MTYKWYQIIDSAEFEALGVPSKELEMVLEDVGLVVVRVTKGNLLSLVYDDVILSPDLGDSNLFEFGGYAAYLDSIGILWLGIPDED